MIRSSATPPWSWTTCSTTIVSIEAARDEYGVVITGAGADLRVDERATAALRGGRRRT